MIDDEMRARAAVLVESLDGVVWEHIESLSDFEAAIIATRAYAQALINTLVKSTSEPLYERLLSDPERALWHLRHAVRAYPWDDAITSVLAEHKKLRSMEAER